MRLLLVLAGFSSIAFAQTVAPVKPSLSTIQQQLRVRVGNDDVPGLVIAISEADEMLWEEGFGWADRERHVRATPSIPFYIASVTKAFTATAILHLAERGKLQIDQPVNKYLGVHKIHSPAWDASQATIRRLLTHTSGLTTFARWCRTAADPRCDVDREIERYGVLVWPPGEQFDYSNLGYGILGYVVAKESGESLDSYLQRTIFQPLQLRNCAIAPGRLPERPAAQYDSETHIRSRAGVTGHEGASGLRCSAADLLSFGVFNLKEHPSPDSPLLSRDIDDMHTAQPGTEGKYGMGWWIRQESGLSIIAAEGGSPDAYALLELIPAKHIAIVIVANSYSQLVGGLKHQVLSALFPELKFVEQPNSTQTEPASVAPPALVGKWSGEMLTFKGPVKVVLNVAPDGGARGQMADQPRAAVTNVTLDATSFHGRLPGNEELADSPHPPFMIDLDVELHDGRLIGAATFGPMPGKGGDQLPHFIKLAKVPAKR
jgi:CubicO group peptidase (beta-lactamase class C family)